MYIYASEEEQVNLMKSWLKANWLWILISIIMVVAVIYLRSYYLKSQAVKLNSAANLYTSLSTDNFHDNAIADKIMKNYKNTVYAKLAVFEQALAAVNQQDFKLAADKYKWLYINITNWDQLKYIAFENWLRSLAAANKLDLALKTLVQEKKYQKKFPISFFNLAGDLHSANHNKSNGIEFYNKALLAFDHDFMLKKASKNYYDWIWLKRNALQ